jgi:ASC-1-like (ASCH) protein
MEINEAKRRIIKAGRRAVEHLIEVAEEKILTGDETDLSADKLKNAAATKKLAIFDAFEILERIEAEQELLNKTDTDETGKGGFAERRAKRHG